MSIRYQNRGTRPLAIAVMALVAALIVACGGDTAEDPDTPAEEDTADTDAAEPTDEAGTEDDDADVTGEGGEPEVDTLVLGALNPGTGIVPVWRAIDEGYFADEGLEVEVELGGGFAEQVPLLARGDIDLAWGGHPAAFSVIAGGVDAVLITEAEFLAEDFYQVLSMADSDVSSPAELEGRTVAVNALGGTPALGVYAAAEEAGLDRDDVSLMVMDFDAMPVALERGEIDAMMLPGPRIANAMANYDVQLVFDFLELETFQEFPTNGYYAMRDFAEANPNAMSAFVRGLERAVEDVQEDVEIQIEYRMELADQEREQAERAPADPIAGVDLDRMRGLVELMEEYELLEEPINIDEHVFSP